MTSTPADIARAEHQSESTLPGRPVLPRWPLVAGFAYYPLWWVLGVGDLIWPVIGIVMIHYLITRAGQLVRAPRGFGVWLLFLAWMAFSAVGLDAFNRVIGFGYRAVLYACAGIVFLYIYNARSTLSPRYVAGVLTSFWLVVTAGGFLGLLFPLLSIRTPLSFIIPGSLQQNELVQEMVIRRATQYNPGAWNPGYPRPSAPFLYTNGWGYAYAILLPIVIAYLITVRGEKRFWWILTALPLSLIPALLSLNRGMFIGLGVALVYVAVRAILAGNIRVILLLLVLCGMAGLAVLSLPIEERLSDRLTTSSTTEDRADLYMETVHRTWDFPVLGQGAPRPSESDGQPSAGTQGQIWMVIFSHGFGAALLFLCWFIIALYRSLQRRENLEIAMGAGILYTLIAVFFYGVVGTGLIMIMTICGVVMRPNPALPAVHQTQTIRSL